MIRKIEAQHISQVAKIHKENLPSFLTEFPLSFIENFYKSQLNNTNNLLIGDFDGENVQGFVFGTDDVDALYGNFIAQNKIYFMLNVIFTLITHPKYILLFASKFFSKSFESPCKRQLVYIAADQKLGNKGIGSRLLTAFDEAWEQYQYYELEVESKNNALQFYEKKGFFLVHEYNNWVEKKLLMGKKLKN